jgi:hypothetical protein
MMPLYAFVEGDTLGLLVFAEEKESIASLARKAQSAASVRVAERAQPSVVYQGKNLDPEMTVSLAGLRPLCRFDVRFSEGEQ